MEIKMNKFFKVLIPIILAIAIIACIGWYLFIYDRDFTRDMLLQSARFFERQGNHSISNWFYDQAYEQASNNDAVAVELAEQHTGSEMLCADLCAGSGCIGISLARLTGCKFHSYELSDKALGYLKENIVLNEVQSLVTAIKADVISEQTVEAAPMYDMIVSNPPYLTAGEMTRLQKEVAFEPSMALSGGEDGLDFYRAILRLWTKRLKAGGLFAVEIGETQAEAVSQLFSENGITPQVLQDLCHNDRVVYGIK